MKTRITIFCLLVSAFVVKAQTKTTVAFLPISYDEGIYSSNEARSIQETVINAFVSSNKFTVVDREKNRRPRKGEESSANRSFSR